MTISLLKKNDRQVFLQNVSAELLRVCVCMRLVLFIKL